MRKKIVVANLKTHFNVHQASIYLHNLDKLITPHRSVEVVIAPSLICLQPLSLELDRKKIKLSAQNAFYEDKGAFTGEVSFNMLEELCDYVIIGHSERRIYFGEDNNIIAKKVKASLRNGIKPILCIGENLNERNEGLAKRVIHDQLVSAISNLTTDEISDIVIAYEPVWAISTFGNSHADPIDVRNMLRLIRYQVSELYGSEVSERIRILYGGSVDSGNIGNYLALDDCDGSLVGGASLDPIEFNKIIQKAYLSQN